MPTELPLTDGPTPAVGLSDAEADARNGYLTTTGRTTGRLHEIEIWFAADPSRLNVLYLLSGGRDRSDWVRNIRIHPNVRMRLNGTTYAGVGHWIDEASDEDARARLIVAKKYGEVSAHGELSGWAQTSLPVAIQLMRPLEGQEHDAHD